jgi:cytidyltransferase-like protein
MLNKKEKILIFGTFDGVHLGHLDFFKQARKLSKNPFLIVSIARDKNVLKIKNKLPFNNEKQRQALVKKTKLAERVVLGSLNNYLLHIIKENPDYIGLGYDQIHYTKNLKKDLKDLGLAPKIRRLKPYKENIYKNSLLNKKNT